MTRDDAAADLLGRARPLPQHPAMAIDELDTDEGAAFLAAVQEARASNVPAERERLEAKVIALVALARAEGANWGQIGAALGSTRQAARQRYGSSA